MQRSLTAVLACAACTGLGANTPVAAQDYPNKPIRMIIPFAPGGGSDILGRIVERRLSPELGQTVVVDNRGGAGSTLGHALAAEAQADGYTIILSNISGAVNATYYRKLPFDLLKDFQAVTRIADQPNIMVVHPSVKAGSPSDIVALAKRSPGKLNYASAGNGSGTQLAMVLFEMKTGAKMTHVPYKGTGPALNDVVAGQVQLFMSTLASAVPHIRSGRLKAVAVTTADRSSVVPDVPTMQEAGVKDFVHATWYGIRAPAGMPAPVLARLHAALVAAVKHPDTTKRLNDIGYQPVTSTPEEFTRYTEQEIGKWRDVLTRIGLAGVR